MKSTWAVVVLGGCIISAGGAAAAERSADQILKEIDAVKLPTFDATKQRGPSVYVRTS